MFDSQSEDFECAFKEQRKQKWTAEEKSVRKKRYIYVCYRRVPPVPIYENKPFLCANHVDFV